MVLLLSPGEKKKKSKCNTEAVIKLYYTAGELLHTAGEEEHLHTARAAWDLPVGTVSFPLPSFHSWSSRSEKVNARETQM